MSIRYILGNSGSGKLYTCIKEIIEIEKQKELSGILIVPNQFTLQSEKEIMKRISSKVIFNTQILSFKRLAYRIFAELGLNNKIPLENMGKLMVLRKIINNLFKEERLNYFSENSYSNIGVLERISDTIKEFLECNIDVDDFNEILINLDKNNNFNLDIKEKLNDIKEIYTEFKRFIEKDYISSEEVLSILSKKINESKLVDNNTIIWIYGFNGFSSQELNVIQALASKARKINICFTFNSKNINITDINLFEPFYNVKSSIKKIGEKIILNNKVSLEEPLFLLENFRHKQNFELNHLQKNYFSYRPNIYKGKIENIEIYSAQNKFLEIEKAAQKISYLVKEKGYRYNDIALILADSEYKEHLRPIFNKYNLPYFLDYKKNISHHPLVELILSSLDIVAYNWRYEDVFRYIKTGFLQENEDFNINEEKIYIIENYVLEYGIKGDKWKTDFKYGFYSNSTYDKEEINLIRKSVLNSLKNFDFRSNKLYKVRDISKKIFDLLVYLKVDKTLNKWKERDKKIFINEISANTTMLDTNMQVWNKVCEVIDKLVSILGDEDITINEYIKILKTAFKSETIGILPPTQDQILVGDFERTRLGELKVLFCLGMNDGIIPKYEEQKSFITDTERVLLMNNFDLKPNSSVKLVTDDLQIYSTMCKATEKLILSYSISDLMGNSKRKSSIINRIEKIFPKIETQEIDKIKIDLKNINSPNAVFENLFKIYEQIDINSEEYLKFKDIFNWFLAKEEYAKNLKIIQIGLEKIRNKENIKLEKELIEQLYIDKKIITSVTKLEQFRMCPFSYFLKYNIDTKEREIMKLDSLKIGNIYHNVLERFFQEIIYKKIPIDKITEQDIIKIVDKTIEKLKETDDIENIYNSSSKYKYYFNRIRKIALMSSYLAIEDLKPGKFEPEFLEFSFGDLNDKENIFDYIEVDLENSYKLFLTGKIDRVDKLEKGDKNYYKIIDYKSGENKIKEEEIYNGLKLQLFTYLSAFIKLKKEEIKSYIAPAGVAYFQIKEDIDEDNKNPTRLNGLKICDEVDGKEFGALDISGNIYSKHINSLLNLADITIKEIGQEITEGNIEIYPYKYSKKTGCDYCEYKSICKFDILENSSGFHNMYYEKSKMRKKADELDNTEIWQKIYEKINNEYKN